jgi:hypothetical protein
VTALARLSEIEARHMHDQAGDGEPPCCRNCMTDVPALCAALRVAVEAIRKCANSHKVNGADAITAIEAALKEGKP